MSTPESVIRLAEWGTASVAALGPEKRSAIAYAVRAWQEEANLPAPPLRFEGTRGETLRAVQYVGVVEVAGCTVEIYPKLDASLMRGESQPIDATVQTVMGNLVWMLEVSRYLEMTESDHAHLQGAPLSYFDVFAYLMAKNLARELEAGLVHSYQTEEDDLPAIRGRILFAEQVTRNWNRFDRVSCRWDEFTPDVSLNRVLRCACRFLRSRVHNAGPALLLDYCTDLLADVADISIPEALQQGRSIRWNRTTERFKRTFEMALRLLSGSGYQFRHGSGEAFVFLLDMNQLFEKFAASALASSFGVPIDEQNLIGHLFRAPRRAIQQKPDYLWRCRGIRWVGDAKYKHLESRTVLSSLEVDADDDAAEAGLRMERVLNPADVRQLTVYGEILRMRENLEEPPRLAILYPYVGDGEFFARSCECWSGATLWLLPVRVDRRVPMREIVAQIGEAQSVSKSV